MWWLWLPLGIVATLALVFIAGAILAQPPDLPPISNDEEP